MTISGMLRAATLGAGLGLALSGAALAGEYSLTVDRVKNRHRRLPQDGRRL
jgi:hypothetical protein